MGHGRMMWACVALTVAIVLVAAAIGAPLLMLVVIPCIAMVAAMLWMMRGAG